MPLATGLLYWNLKETAESLCSTGMINCPKKYVLKYGQFKCPRYLPPFNEGVCLLQAEVLED